MRATVTSVVVGLATFAFVTGFADFGSVDECDAERLGRRAFGPLSTIYTVEGGELAGICHGVDDPTVYDAWSNLTLFTTAEERSPIVGFGGFRNTSQRDVLAYATALDRDQTRFMIVVNLSMVELEPWLVRRTMAHEFGHVLTRSAAGVDSNECGEFGCVSNTNYMGLWVDRFWSDAELASIEAGGYHDLSGTADRCRANAGFPTKYAATNPYEDFSESLEFFLFSNRVAAPVSPRIQFLSSFPELVRMRDRIAAKGYADTRQFLQNCGV
ncbi:MAG: hypothetical protein HKN24_03855 [Acidimicrobiales bacterium]|nr:hypothetical protein [Acidimicrobiales bacterium]